VAAFVTAAGSLRPRLRHHVVSIGDGAAVLQLRDGDEPAPRDDRDRGDPDHQPHEADQASSAAHGVS